MTPPEIRQLVRAGWAPDTTAGFAPGHVQANLVVLPAGQAEGFAEWCAANPAPCPVVAKGGRFLPRLGEDLDLATDLPRYRIWRDGVPVAAPTDVSALWRDDLVAFALGCSYSFDAALLEAGLPLRHLQQRSNPPIYESSIQTVPVGGFSGPIVVSMRPFTPADAERARQVTAPLPLAHGAPLHIGDPSAIGVDLARRSGGDALPLHPGEVPVFWACGVTPELALRNAKIPFAITHYPGAMLVTDLWLSDLAG